MKPAVHGVVFLLSICMLLVFGASCSTPDGSADRSPAEQEPVLAEESVPPADEAPGADEDESPASAMTPRGGEDAFAPPRNRQEALAEVDRLSELISAQKYEECMQPIRSKQDEGGELAGLEAYLALPEAQGRYDLRRIIAAGQSDITWTVVETPPDDIIWNGGRRPVFDPLPNVEFTAEINRIIAGAYEELYRSGSELSSMDYTVFFANPELVSVCLSVTYRERGGSSYAFNFHPQTGERYRLTNFVDVRYDFITRFVVPDDIDGQGRYYIPSALAMARMKNKGCAYGDYEYYTPELVRFAHPIRGETYLMDNFEVTYAELEPFLYRDDP